MTKRQKKKALEAAKSAFAIAQMIVEGCGLTIYITSESVIFHEPGLHPEPDITDRSKIIMQFPHYNISGGGL